MITVREVNTKKSLREFRNLSDTIYANTPQYVPMIKLDLKEAMSKKHPFYEHSEAQFFIAHDDLTPVGRLCAYKNNRHNEYHKDKVGFIGSFDCIDDQEVANTLFDRAKLWLNARDLNEIRGPIDYYSNEPQGLLIDGFDTMPPAPLPYHLPYYRTLLENYGFTKQADLYAYGLDDLEKLPFHRGVKLVERITSRSNITFRPMDLNNLDDEVKNAVELFNIFETANGQNFIPITEAEAAHFIKLMKPILDPELIYFAEIEDKVIGFVANIPDVNELLITVKNGKLLPAGIFKLLRIKKYPYKRIRMMLLGMRDEYKKIGLGPALCHKALQRARERGFKTVDMSMIHEDNQLMRNTCENLGGQIYKSYRVYQLSI